MRRALAAVLLVATSACSRPALVVTENSQPFPGAAVPDVVAGMRTRAEPSAEHAFASIGETSAVQRGAVWSLLRDGVVVGAVQVSQLKGGLSTDTDTVRRGVYAAVGNGRFRWFKVAGRQWVGVQQDSGFRRYLWLPDPRDDMFVVLQLKSEVPDPEGAVAELVTDQQEGLR